MVDKILSLIQTFTILFCEITKYLAHLTTSPDTVCVKVNRINKILTVIESVKVYQRSIRT